jgi:Fe-S cluster assembly protein SufD
MSSVVEQQTASSRGDRFVADFEARVRRGELGGPAWLDALRRRGLADFTAQGFPSTRDEEWRLTPVNPIANTAFVQGELLHVRPDALADSGLGDETAAELVFVNGWFVPALSQTQAVPDGLEVAALADVIRAQPGALEPWLNDLARAHRSPFTALNTAFIEDGAFVRIRKGAVVGQPIHLLFYSTVSGAPSLSHPRVLVVAEEHSEAHVVETYAGAAGHVYLTNAVSEFIIGNRAILDHYRVQRESTAAYHIASMNLRTARETVFTSQNLVFGGAIVRNDIGAVLAGEGGDTTLNGLYLGGGTQLVDTHTTIDHALPHNGSHELYKGILGGKARGIFNGKIIVRPDAQKTDAKQTNKALLLSDEAQINSKPQLEIFADDVKCTHGATVGQLDPEMLFYLRARGLGFDEARGLLIRGFAGDIINRIKVAALRERLDAELTARIPK